MKKNKEYYCKELNCNNEICYATWKYGQNRCRSCAHKGERSPTFGKTGRLSNLYIDGRSTKKHCCKELGCNNEIHWTTAIYENGRCKSCSKKDKLHSNYIDGRNLNKYYCIDCNKEISCSSGFYGLGRCNSCKGKGELSNAWNNGSSFEPYPLGWNKTFKEQIRYRDSYKCQICDKPEVECNSKLHVHHIDYDKENINPENLLSACKSCHMKTNGNRDYWYVYCIYIMIERGLRNNINE